MKVPKTQFYFVHMNLYRLCKTYTSKGIKHVIYKNSYDADKGSGLEFLEKSGCNVEKIRVDNES